MKVAVIDTGVDKQVSRMVLKVSDGGVSDSKVIADGIRYAIANHADVINLG